jgi:hypothetical protein
MLTICAIYGLSIAILFIVAQSDLAGGFIGIGATLGSLIALTIASIPVPYIIRFLLSPPPLEQYHFQLYEPNPGSSQVIRRLANVYDTFAYLYAVQALIFSISAILSVSTAFYIYADSVPLMDSHVGTIHHQLPHPRAHHPAREMEAPD